MFRFHCWRSCSATVDEPVELGLRHASLDALADIGVDCLDLAGLRLPCLDWPAFSPCAGLDGAEALQLLDLAAVAAVLKLALRDAIPPINVPRAIISRFSPVYDWASSAAFSAVASSMPARRNSFLVAS